MLSDSTAIARMPMSDTSGHAADASAPPAAVAKTSKANSPRR
jgi:hypothetical protein